MQIQSVKLENVKSYADGTIEFAAGTNAIVGHNGAGKSTILEAIGFALFDHIGYRQDDFVKAGAKTAVVTVTFVSSLDEREYQVIRRCGSTSSHVIFDPALDAKLCEGKADVLIFLREHLGADPGANLGELFTNAVGVPQGTLTAAFLDTPARRKTIFDPLLRVEEYRKAWENLREPARLLSQRQNDVEVTISGLEGRLERLPQLQEEVAGLERAMAAARKELERTAEELAAAQERRAGMENQRAAIAALRAGVEQARQQVEMNRGQAQAADRRLAEAESAHAAVEANRDGHTAYAAALAEKETLDTQTRERQQVRDRLAGLDKQLSLAQAEIERQQAALAEIAEAEEKVSALAPAVTEQAEAEAALREAEQRAARLSDVRERFARTEAESRQAAAQVERLETQLAQTEPLEKSLAEAEAAVAAAQAQMADGQSQLARQQAESDALRKQITGLQQADGALCPVCEEPLSDERRKELLARNSTRLNELEQTRTATKKAITEAEKALRAAQTDVKTGQEALRRLPRADELHAARERVSELERVLAEAGQLQDDLAAAPEQVTALTAQLQALGNPRQQRDFAKQTADRRPQTEAALARQEEILAEAESAAFSLRGQLEAFAGLDEAQARVADAIARHRQADDIYRRNQQAAAGLADRHSEATDARTLLGASQKQLTEATESLKEQAAAFDEAQYREAAAAEERLRGRQGSLEGQVAEQERRRGQIGREMEELAARQAELESAQERRRALAEQAELLESLRRVLRDAGPFVTKALVQQISYGAGQLFSEIMQDHSRHLRWDEEYGILLEVDGRDRQFAQLSGGEQMAAALSVRLALLREMSDIQVAFFDEPTSNLDEARRESLARQILSIEGFRQLFVISHDDTFEQATEKLVRVQKVNGVSVVG